jgi:hypothetical protein
MRNSIIVLFCALTPMLCGQQAIDSAKVSSFNKIEVYDGILIYLERGEKECLYGVDKTKTEELNFSVENNTLKIRKIVGNKYENDPAVKITYKSLEAIAGYGKANIHTKNLVLSDSIDVKLKSGAVFYGSFDIKYLNADITEGCLFTADGYANEQIIDVNLKATFSGFELEGITASVKASTGGKAKMNVTDKLKAYASTGGYIGYKGDPKLDKQTSLGGKVIHDID